MQTPSCANAKQQDSHFLVSVPSRNCLPCHMQIFDSFDPDVALSAAWLQGLGVQTVQVSARLWLAHTQQSALPALAW
jgi:hypothetical protein